VDELGWAGAINSSYSDNKCQVCDGWFTVGCDLRVSYSTVYIGLSECNEHNPL